MASQSSTTAKRPTRAVRSRPARRGLTLIELVMVVALLGLLAAIAIPGIQLAVEGRAVREAARSVNVYLGAARNRAMVTGRPVGVALQRFTTDRNVCITLDQVEALPTYAGDEFSARVQVQKSSTGFLARFDGSFTASGVRVGDRIQFNHQGPWYDITGPQMAADDTRIQPNSDVSLAPVGHDTPWPDDGTNWSALMPYQIQRQPLRDKERFYVSIAKPVQLPLDAVIDLTFSGFSGTAPNGEGHFSTANGGTSPVVIMFSPEGAIDCVYVAGTRYSSIERVYLLIGKRERIPAGSADDLQANWQDLENLWIGVTGRAGMVTTVELKAATNMVDSREYASQSESIGGR